MATTWDCSSQHIVLVGMMGAGKSTVGRAMAQRLDRPLLDTDSLIEERERTTVRELFADVGEPAFRALETEVLRDALDNERPVVIAAGGGVVLSAANRALLTESGAHIVWLLADVDLLAGRVRNGTHRPLLDDDPERTLRAMFDDRADLYREVADAIVSVDNRTVTEVAQAVLRCCA